MGSLIRKAHRPDSKASDRDNKDNRGVLLKRLYGGIGDILMTRPLMREIKKINSSVILHYAIPKSLIPLVIDLEDIDEIIPVENISDEDENHYGWSGDISTACIKHEIMFRSKVHEQRMDLWAKHVQVELTQHHAALRFTKEEHDDAMHAIAMSGCNVDRYMAIIPVSADKSRRLPENHIQAACSWAIENGFDPVILTEKPWDGSKLCPNVYELDMRVWMAAISHASMFFGTDTGGLHVAGFAGVPGAAVFCHTSGKIVCKHYSSIVPVQMHREDTGGMSCCPCYDWGSCPHSNKQLPLKCLSNLNVDNIRLALDSARLRDNGSRRYGTIDVLDVTRIRNEDPSIIAGQGNTAKDKRIGIVLTCRDSRPGLAAVAGCISAMARSMHRNTLFLVNIGGKAAELLRNHRYASLVQGEVDEHNKCADEWETHILDGLMSGNKSLVDAVIERFGIDVRNGYPCIYVDKMSMEVFESEHSHKQNFWFVSSVRKVDCSGYEIVRDNPAWNWQTRFYAMSRSVAVVTDDLDTAIVAALSRHALIYLGPRQNVLEKLPHVYICTDHIPSITRDTIKTLSG